MSYQGHTVGEPCQCAVCQNARHYQQWLKTNTAVAAEFHHQQYPLTDAWKSADMDRWPLGWSPMQYERYRNFWCLL